MSRTGDLWLLGKHNLLCGDSTVATDVERVLEFGRESWPADQVERWPIDRLIPYAKNSRTHSEAAGHHRRADDGSARVDGRANPGLPPHRQPAGAERGLAYVDVAVKRWQAFTGLEAKLDGDGRSFEEIALERAAQDRRPEPAEPRVGTGLKGPC